MNLTVIKEKEVLGKDFKIYGSVENPLFLAKDVAEWIEYSKSNGKYKVSQMVSTVDEDEKMVSIIKTPDMIQSREMIFLTEDGLYEVLMQSRKPIAKLFKKEVKKILKSIRQNGFYAPTTYLEALKALVQKEEKLLEANTKLEIQAPKVEYHDKVLNINNLITTTKIAKDLSMSARKLNEELHSRGIIYKHTNTWLFYSEYQNMIPEYADYHISEYGQQLKWTEKGRKFIINLFKK